MKKLFLSLFAFTIHSTSTLAQVERKELGNLVIENIPEIPQQLKDRIFQSSLITIKENTYEKIIHNAFTVLFYPSRPIFICTS